MRRTLAVVIVALAAAVGTVAPAHAGPATGNVTKGSEFGTVLRAEFKQNVDGSGYWWRTFGSGNCTSVTSDADFSWSDMDTNQNWDNVVSYIRDDAQCDVRIFQFKNFSTPLTGYVHYGPSGQSLGSTGLNNLTSSYRLSGYPQLNVVAC